MRLLVAAVACALAASFAARPADAARGDTPPPIGEPPAAFKGDALSDGDDFNAKLAVSDKVKDCCGYPVGEPAGFRLSYYWIAYEAEYALEKRETDIYTKEGYWIGRYPSAFVYELKLEGSGILLDGRVLNYDGECRYGIGTCFKFLDRDRAPLGTGVQGRPLVPFRSIAVDPRYIPIGSPVYVPELVGVLLPDGTPHDGCLRADDQGGAIKFKKMDFFVESYFNFKFMADQLWWKMKGTPHLDEPRCEYLRLGLPREHDNEHTDWALLHGAHGAKLRQALAQKIAKPKRQVLTASLASRSRAKASPGRRR